MSPSKSVLDYGSHGVTPVCEENPGIPARSTQQLSCLLLNFIRKPNPAPLHLNPPGGSQAQSCIPQDHVRLLSSKGIDKGSGCSFGLKNSRLFLLQDKDSLNDNMIIALENTFLGTLYSFRTFHKRLNSALPFAWGCFHVFLTPSFPDLK